MINLKKRTLFGNKISNSNHKVRRKFLVNSNTYYFKSEILKNKYKFKSSSNYYRTLKMYGGIDTYLIKTSNAKLNSAFLQIKKKIIKKIKKLY